MVRDEGIANEATVQAFHSRSEDGRTVPVKQFDIDQQPGAARTGHEVGILGAEPEEGKNRRAVECGCEKGGAMRE